MPAWFETLDDRMWLRPDEGGEAEADFIRRALHLRRGQTVLDAPCGAGRVSLPLARRGIRVVGVDLRPTFLKRAGRRARRETLPLELRHQDLRHARFEEGTYHAVFCWFNSFGYFSEKENEDLLQRWAGALRPGGRLLIDQINRERVLRKFRPQHESGGIHYRSRWDTRRQRIHLSRNTDAEAKPQNTSSQRWYTPAQLRHLMAKAGLSLEATYGSADAAPYNSYSPQMILVARKNA